MSQKQEAECCIVLACSVIVITYNTVSYLTALIAAPSHHGVAAPFQVGDGGGSVQVWTAAANMSHVTSVMEGRGWSSSVAVVRGIRIRYRKYLSGLHDFCRCNFVSALACELRSNTECLIVK